MGRGAAVSGESRCRPRGRRRALITAGALAATLGLAACASGTHFADNPKPALQETLSVYVDNHHVSISPDTVGAGPVLLIITNEATSTQSVTIRNASGAAVASSGPIASQQAAQLPATLNRLGHYEILTGSGARAAGLKITRARPNSDRTLLAP